MTVHVPCEPHYLVCYFGGRYAPMLGVLLQSIADTTPCRKVVLLHYETPADVLWMACNYPNVITLPVEKQAYPAGMAAALKPLIISDYLKSPPLAGPALVVDCDMLVRRDPFDLFRDGDGILFTVRDGVWPINGGIIGIRDPLCPAVADFFRHWADRIAAIARDPALLTIARSEKHPYGHVDQMAFAQTIGYSRGKLEFHLGDCSGLTARAIDGYVLNETRSVPIHPETRILHYKGGWHPILLDGHPFTRNRPLRQGWQMFTLYYDVHRRAIESTRDKSCHAVLGNSPTWYDSQSHAVHPVRYLMTRTRGIARNLTASAWIGLGRARRVFARVVAVFS